MAICPGCNLNVDPVRIFEKSLKGNKWWRITKCPRERCGFNMDLEECDKPGPSYMKSKEGGRSFWGDPAG